MKYIILETDDGMKLPVIFPDILAHVHVAGAMQFALETLDITKDLRPRQMEQRAKEGPGKVASAGFVSIGLGTLATGESESLGVKSNMADTGRIVMDGAVAYLPDEMVLMTFARLIDQMKGAK